MPLHIASWNQNKDAFSFVLEIYRYNFLNREMRKILFDKNSGNASILLNAMRAKNNVETLKVLWDFMENPEFPHFYDFEEKIFFLKTFVSKNFRKEEKKNYF